VLRLMFEQHRIGHDAFGRAQLRAALKAPLPAEPHHAATQGPAPYFTEYVKQQLVDQYGSAKVFGGGLRVETTIDLGLQRLARKAIGKVLTDPNGPAAALVAIRPSDGAVLA